MLLAHPEFRVSSDRVWDFSPTRLIFAQEFTRSEGIVFLPFRFRTRKPTEMDCPPPNSPLRRVLFFPPHPFFSFFLLVNSKSGIVLRSPATNPPRTSHTFFPCSSPHEFQSVPVFSSQDECLRLLWKRSFPAVFDSSEFRFFLQPFPRGLPFTERACLTISKKFLLSPEHSLFFLSYADIRSFSFPLSPYPCIAECPRRLDFLCLFPA